MALPLLPYCASNRLAAMAATVLFSGAASSAVVVSIGVNFLEDVEIESINLGPIWSKTSPMFCMRLASFDRWLPVAASCCVLPLAVLLWVRFAP